MAIRGWGECGHCKVGKKCDRIGRLECEGTLGLRYQERDIDHISFVWSIEVITKKL